MRVCNGALDRRGWDAPDAIGLLFAFGEALWSVISNNSSDKACRRSGVTAAVAAIYTHACRIEWRRSYICDEVSLKRVAAAASQADGDAGQLRASR